MIGDRLKQLRTDRGMTQEELALRLGMSRSAYSLYETDRREPDINNLIKISTFFGVTLDFLLGVSSVNTPPKQNNSSTEDTAEELKELLIREKIIPNERPLTDTEREEILRYSKYILQRKDEENS